MNPHLHLEVLGRLLLGGALGAIIGYERDLHGRPAGLRTHALVGLASATDAVEKLNVKRSQVSYERDVAAGRRVFEAMLSLPSALNSHEVLKARRAAVSLSCPTTRCQCR